MGNVAKTDWIVKHYRREARNFRSAARAERRWAAQAKMAGIEICRSCLDRAERLDRMAAEAEKKATARASRVGR